MMIKDNFLTMKKLREAGVDLACENCGKEGSTIKRDLWSSRSYLKCFHCNYIMVGDIELALEQD